MARWVLVGQGGPAQGDPGILETLMLAVQGQVVAELVHQNTRQLANMAARDGGNADNAGAVACPARLPSNTAEGAGTSIRLALGLCRSTGRRYSSTT